MTLSIKRIVAILAACLILAGLVAETASVLTIRATIRLIESVIVGPPRPRQRVHAMMSDDP